MQLRFYPQFSWCAREDVNSLLICYRWRLLATVMMVVVVKQGGSGSEEAVGIVNDGGGGA